MYFLRGQGSLFLNSVYSTHLMVCRNCAINVTVTKKAISQGSTNLHLMEILSTGSNFELI